MCGIGGIAVLGRDAELTEQDRRVLPRMQDALAHRGPDESNIRTEGQVGLVFTRLSVFGVASGMQPFVDDPAGLRLMANGEVYNHTDLAALHPGYRPRTESDCEVLLAQYAAQGVDLLRDVRGILAVVVHDTSKRHLVLATDPFANKPLFFARAGDRIVFASEIKALFEHPEVDRGIDWSAALQDHAVAGTVGFTHASPATWFRGVRKVNAGTVVTIDLLDGTESIHRYWEPRFPDSDDRFAGDVKDFVTEYRRLLFRSVEDSLMAEAGLGLFLSGGIDSAAIAAIAARLGTPLRVFTVDTDGTRVNGDLQAAAQVAELFDLPLTVAELRPDDVPSGDDWRRLLWMMESPLTGPGQFYKFGLHKAAKSVYPDLKAMLLGTGADEFNGGYTQLLGGGHDWTHFQRSLRLLSAADLGPVQRWWRAEPQWRLITDLPGVSAERDDYADFVRWKYRDVEQYNCWMEDRCAAGNGIEARVPFLDSALVDHSTQVPHALREVLLWDKAMARAAVADLLPQEIVRREKKPFYDGSAARFAHETILAMLRADDAALVEEALAGPRMADIVNPESLRAAVHADAGGVHPQILLNLVNLGLLDSMVSAGPVQPFRPEHVQVPMELSRPDAAASVADHLESDTRLRLAGTTRLVRDVHEPTRWLLLDGNHAEFVIDEAAVSDWVTLLSQLSGHEALGQLGSRLGLRWQEHRAYLETLLERGMLETVLETADA
jgi:asparagine synthase (glutamine-hydrolysing)